MSFFWSRFFSLPEDPDGFLSPPVFFSRLPVLETEDLLLRLPRLSDAKDVHAYATDPEVARYVLWDPHRSLADTRAFLRDLRARARRGYPSSWAVVLKETGAVIGTIGFIWYSTDNRSAELGYSFRWIPGLITPSAYGYLYGYLPGLHETHGIRWSVLYSKIFDGTFSEAFANTAPRGFPTSVTRWLAG